MKAKRKLITPFARRTTVLCRDTRHLRERRRRRSVAGLPPVRGWLPEVIAKKREAQAAKVEAAQVAAQQKQEKPAYLAGRASAGRSRLGLIARLTGRH